jgi:branched-chain amino acid transport system ATP-binding protein
VIEVRDLVVRYGPATALDHVSLHVDAGEMVALIGPNGAGKSTLVNTLSGILKPASGSVTVSGRLAHVPEGRQVFGDLTVEDNLRLGGRRYRERDTAPVHAVLPRLAELRHRRAGTLSGGEQQMVAVGRALMSRPDVLAIDELSLGLAPLVVADLVRHIRDLNAERGLAVLLIEQNARLALDLCARAYVVEAGRIVAEGPSEELAGDERVSAAYLGGVVGDAERSLRSEP